MNSRKFYLGLFIILGVIFVYLLNYDSIAYAKGGRRFPIKTYSTLARRWQVRKWENGDRVCDVFVNHLDFPNDIEISESCGDLVYQEWVDTPLCTAALDGGDLEECSGVFFQYIGLETHEVTEWLLLPEPSVEAELDKCKPGIWCDERPSILFTGFEPIFGYQILELHIQVGDKEVVCDGPKCKIRMPLTSEEGILVSYWAVSSYGDESDQSVFRLRNLVTREGDPKFRIELLGEEWESIAPSCSVIWDSFPSIDSQDDEWLRQPDDRKDLYTDKPYSILAGQLIWNGLVDVSSCSSGGLLFNLVADGCGELAASTTVVNFQNKYNDSIFNASHDVNVPSYALKGIIAQESQFWPYSDIDYEYGLGRLTENGVDMLLTWNLGFYVQVCEPIWGNDYCGPGYPNLSRDERALLRGVVLSSVGTQEEIPLLAETMKASCAQVGNLVTNVTGFRPGAITSYEDLWKMSVGIYHSGSGCISAALEQAWQDGRPITWEEVSFGLEGVCQSAREYVMRVIQLSK